MDRDSTQQYVLRLAGSGGLQVGGSGLEIKTNGILSPMIAAGAILAAHVGFTSANVPDASTYGGPTIQNSLDAAFADIQLRVKRDGTTPMTGNLNMNGFKVSGLADGVAVSDAVTLQQMQNYVSLGMRWLYPCGYAGVGMTHGCLRPNGKVRASQTVHMSSTTSLVNKTISFDGATITFTAALQVPGDNKCTVSAGSIPTTMTNLISAINTSTNLVTSKGVALGTVAYASLESGMTTLHITWEADDAVPSTANGLPCGTTATGAMLQFINVDPITSNGRFYGAYDSVMDGGTIQGRLDNGVYMYDVDQLDWTLIFANPGTNFFTTASGDSGGQINAGLNGNLAVLGGTGIVTNSAVSGFPPGARLTINHDDIGTDVLQYHAEESIRLNTPYSEVGTAVADHQDDFNSSVNALLGDARRTALNNVMVNGSFIADPTGLSHSFDSTAAHTSALIPGWAMYDISTSGTNQATIDLDAGPVGTYPAGGTAIGANCAKIDVTSLSGSVATVWFYQPVVGGEQFRDKPCTFRASVFSPVLAIGYTPRLFIEDSTMSPGAPFTGPAHSGLVAQYEELYVNTTIAATAAWVKVGLEIRSAGTYYLDAAACVFGALYSNMPIVPRPEIEDYQLIDSMYQNVNWWATLVNAGACDDYLLVPFGTAMMSVPTVTPTADPATFPGGITTMVITEVTTPAGRGTTRHGTTLELNVSVGAAVQGDTVGGDIALDARPT